ncbi:MULTISPECIES: DUF397 domain-containing protein [Streptomyces]|uniref:DUF397 domain-containing protein n=2 Tax=Streptomyces rimosus subsp. rimosus TaxID=132474 RepID=L8EVI3_STRR1|nr:MULTISPECIES: DUF397 domain-containing protein [Streptomyces]KOG71667.1 hypothetical protein ADK78_23295 [Kitasatospora aureofaciens]MYT47559.1 DUF397 domain-containing protein [Streptomyces sp. SID5471]KEF05903.1 hypothetical protein DF17_17030 [Streptomyces rimosus]KEF17285.1 hypothetical protein DF18_30300 [Streptomyces rimosus]KOT28265.1 hypothetical protein ADK84_36295 [Streptomyces sp. NRRL WC-3701]
MPEFSYRKSSYSNPEHECVEVGVGPTEVVAIRDSKRPDSPTLRVSATAWAAFLTTLHTES